MLIEEERAREESQERIPVSLAADDPILVGKDSVDPCEETSETIRDDHKETAETSVSKSSAMITDEDEEACQKEEREEHCMVIAALLKDGGESDDMTTAFARSGPPVSMKTVQRECKSTPSKEADICDEQMGADRETANPTVGSTGVRMNGRRYAQSEEVAMASIMDELRDKLKCRKTEVQVPKVIIDSLPDSKAFTLPSARERTAMNGDVKTTMMTTQTTNARVAGLALRRDIVESSDHMLTETTLSVVTNVSTRTPRHAHSPQKSLPAVTAFRTRRVRRLQVPPHAEDRLPSQDARIQMELKSLRARKKVRGGDGSRWVERGI
jgi:hypothetical protein